MSDKMNNNTIIVLTRAVYIGKLSPEVYIVYTIGLYTRIYVYNAVKWIV